MMGETVKYKGYLDKVCGVSCDKHGMTVKLKSSGYNVPVGEIKVAFPENQFGKTLQIGVIKV